MDTIKKRLSKDFGYTPTEFEVVDLYRCGELLLTDKEEDSILQYLEKQ